MANFTTHIGVGTIVSGALATLTLAADVIDHQSLVAVTLAGVVGSVLPDIDLKDSRPSRALFSGLAIFFSFAVLFNCAGKYSIAELWIVWLGTLLGVRYAVHGIFHHIAVHRGIWHSLLATVFCAIATAVVFKYVLGTADGIAWLGAGFLAIGYLTHLTLDEIYSVDVMDVRIKASFGTALKLADFGNPSHSAAMAVGAVALALIAPPATDFVNGLSSQKMWAGLQDRMLPKDAWFGLAQLGAGTRAAVHAPPRSDQPVAHGDRSVGDGLAGSGITTGSIPSSAPVGKPATEKPDPVTPR